MLHLIRDMSLTFHSGVHTVLQKIGARLGKSLGKKMAAVTNAIKALSANEITQYDQMNGSITVLDIEFRKKDGEITVISSPATSAALWTCFALRLALPAPISTSNGCRVQRSLHPTFQSLAIIASDVHAAVCQEKKVSENVSDIAFIHQISWHTTCQVLRDFKPPEGRTVSQSDMDAGGDGKLLVVLDLQADTALSQVLPLPPLPSY